MSGRLAAVLRVPEVEGMVDGGAQAHLADWVEVGMVLRGEDHAMTLTTRSRNRDCRSS